MSKLHLRIDKYMAGQTSRPPTVYAKIYTLGEGAKRIPGSQARQELVPISSQQDQVARVDVEPGHYYVEVVLPSGEILADDVFVEEGQPNELVLRGEHSPHEWLSWQHFAGNVPARPVVEQRLKRASATGRAAAPPRKVLQGATKTGGAKGGGGAKGSAGPKSVSHRPGRTLEDRLARIRGEEEAEVVQPPEVTLRAPIHWLSTPHPVLAKGEVKKEEVWGWLAALGHATPQKLIADLNGGNAPLPVLPNANDAAHSVFRVSWDDSGSGATSFKATTSRAPRHFVVVPRLGSVELVSLPMPWKVLTGSRDADIEIVVQEPAEPAEFCASAIARDEEFGMLLAYLSSGALPTARDMAERAKEMLYHKGKNPFAAAAGGYALVGTASQASKREWHDWVENLMNRFPRVPDGAIQWGQLRMRMRRSASDLKEAREAFKLAYRRGLPFYSMGVRWLLDGLELVSRDDDEAAEMLKKVRQIAWRTNYQQAFTILRLGGEQSV